MSSIAIAATNPCHVYHLAKELHRVSELHAYYSGYPGWKLPESVGMPLVSFPLRTLSTYAMLRYVPSAWRPKDHHLFQWQDEHFDHSVAKNLRPAEVIHGLPGQCQATFERAHALGMTTVLNHATGPIDAVQDALSEEYGRLGMAMERETRLDHRYRNRFEREMALADYHCVASTVVAEQMKSIGISNDRLWVVPYGADESVFYSTVRNHHKGPFRIVFAGQLTLRKGVRFLLEALTQAAMPSWEMHFYGPSSHETRTCLTQYQGATPLTFHGAVSQDKLAHAFRQADLLVLPSLEEGFGLVVVQALCCGLPCVVSHQTGAKDLIRHRVNGSIVPVADPERLAQEILWWSHHRMRVEERHPWSAAAARLLHYHRSLKPIAA